MEDRVGEVWETSHGCIYLVIGRKPLAHAKHGFVWDMRSLHEPGFGPGRWVQMNEDYLVEQLTQLT